MPQYINKFLVWYKQFGSAQNILGPVQGKGIRVVLDKWLNIDCNCSYYIFQGVTLKLQLDASWVDERLRAPKECGNPDKIRSFKVSPSFLEHLTDSYGSFLDMNWQGTTIDTTKQSNGLTISEVH